MSTQLALFDGERERKKSFLNDTYLPGSCAAFGFAFACFLNWSTRRPVFSGDVTTV